MQKSVGRKRVGVAWQGLLHSYKALLARPILVEADVIRIQVGEDLPAQF